MRFVLALAVLLLFANDAFAASPAFCDGYARRALAAVQLAKNRKCGFKIREPGDPPLPDGRWSDIDSDHRRFCLTANQETLTNEEQARGQLLTQCGECRLYADQAAKAESANIKYACGLEK